MNIGTLLSVDRHISEYRVTENVKFNFLNNIFNSIFIKVPRVCLQYIFMLKNY